MFKGYLEKHIKYFSEPLFFTLAASFFIVTACCCWGWYSLGQYNNKQLVVVTPRGMFKTNNDYISKRYWQAIAYLAKNTTKDDTVIVVPQGESISFFSERRNPLRYFTLQPPFFKMTDENRIILQFSESHADYIVIVQVDTTQYGATSFGIDYAKKLNIWIKENYQLVKLIGPYPFTSEEFGIAIFKRK
jgi:hypothetical protein